LKSKVWKLAAQAFLLLLLPDKRRPRWQAKHPLKEKSPAQAEEILREGWQRHPFVAQRKKIQRTACRRTVDD
jgi:hypothetical protein